MNDEIKEILRIAKECHYIDISFEESDLLLDYITNLQSNWNSLREWLEDEKIHCEGYFDWVLEKMNELEGVDNENN